MGNPTRTLAEQIKDLDRRIRAKSSTSQLKFSSIEDGAITAFDSDGAQRQLIGRQWDGTYLSTSSNGPIPPTPSNPTVNDGTESVVVGWLGTFLDFGILPMDFLRVDIHAGTSSGFTPTHDNRVGTISAPTGGEVTVGLAAGTYWFKLVCWTVAGSVSIASTAVSGDAWPVIAATDGFAPASSPAVEVIGGLDILLARWTAITNADPVTYDVDISATTGFTPDSTTLAGRTSATSFTIKALPGPPPALPTDDDVRKLQYDTPYYIRITARDADGAALPGAEGSANIFQVTGVNLSADSVTAAHVQVGTLTGDLFSASVIISGAFRTAETGQRVEMTPLGFFAYKPDGSIMLKIPTDSPDAFFDGELIVRGATVLGGMSIRSSQNEVTADGALTLMRGIVAPITTPQFQITWDTVIPSTTGLTAVQKTTTDPDWTLGAPFDLVASEVVYTRWVSAETMWIFFQQRSNGTRVWYFNPDGTPKDRYGTGVYCTDVKDWHIWSEVELTASPGKNGTYTMFRFLPNDTYYVNTPVGIKRYSRQNGVAAPALGHNGTDIFTAEVINTNQLQIRYFVPITANTSMPTAFATYISAQGYNANVGLSNVWQSAFDIGSARYLTAERGNTSKALLVYTSGSGAGSIHLGGTTAVAGSWTQSTKDAESFEAPTTRRCTAWDGTQFWTYGSDGLFYKHTAEKWDPSVTSSLLWGRVTLRDAVGTTHETTPGTAKSFTHKRRAKFVWTPPSVPYNGGVDDPDRACLYMGRGSTQPANAAMYKQGESVQPTFAALTITTLTTATANPPTVNSFPASNPALIRNDNDELQIKGDGSILGLTIAAPSIRVGTTYATGDNVAIDGPYWLGWISTQAVVAHNTLTTLTSFTAEGSPNSSGVTVATGIFTVPKAGIYKLHCQLWWAPIASPTGTRLLQVVSVSPSAVLASHTIGPSATADAVNVVDKEIRLAANQQVFFRFRHLQGVGTTTGPNVGSLDLSFINIRYLHS